MYYFWQLVSLSSGRKDDVGDALGLVVHAYNRVHSSTIVRCWVKTEQLLVFMRSPDKTEVVSLLQKLKRFTLEILPNVHKENK